MNVRALKILVVAMAVLLVVGLAALVAIVAIRLSHRPPAPFTAFTAPPVTLPRGATIERMSTNADRIVLDVGLADGSVELVVIDLATGRLVSIFPLKEAP
jgi:Family of unknown function (DUF6476)